MSPSASSIAANKRARWCCYKLEIFNASYWIIWSAMAHELASDADADVDAVPLLANDRPHGSVARARARDSKPD
jgi:hypothetical protein